MAYDFSKGSKTIRKVGFLDGVNGSKIRPVSPFPLESSKGLVAKYFDSTKESLSATRLLDQSPLNSGTRRTGEEGRCVDLNGVNQAIRVADNTALDITDNMTVCVWAKNDNDPVVGNNVIISKYDIVGSKREYLVRLNSNNKLEVFIGTSGGSAGTTWESSSSVTPDFFNFYAFTFSSGYLTVYLNGVEFSGSVTTGPIPSSLINATADLIFGAFLNNNTLIAPWDGQIFDARIYAGDSTVLTAEQIAAIYADGPNNIQFAGQTLAAHYKLDEQSGTTCYDSSGNGNHGTIENAVSNWGITQNILSFQNQVGYNTSGDVYIPRDESDPTNDVLGNPLTNTGRRPNDAALHSSNCLTADGTLYIAAAHLAGTETVVSSGGTSTPSISAGRIDFTAGTCWDLTLSDGTHYPLSEGGGIGIHDDSGSGNHGILTNAVLANAWGGSQDSYNKNLSDGFVYAYQPAKQVFTGAQAANITGISFKFRSTDTNLIIFSDNTPSLYLIYCATGSISPSWRNGISGMTLAIDGSTEWGTTLGDLYNALCDGGIHEVVLTNLSFSSSWVTDGIFVNRYTGTQQWNSTTYLWDLQATDSNGDPIYPADPDVRLPAVTSSLGPYSIPLTDLPSNSYRNRAETLIDLDPDSTPEMNNIYLESVFNGSTSNGYVTNDSVLNFTDNLTVSCWAKSDLTDITSSADTLVSMYESTGNLQVWRMEISTDEKLRFQVGNSGGTGSTIETADSAYPIDAWTHYAATFDGGVVSLYINGELQSSSESSAHATSLNGRSAPLVLGAYYWSGGGGSFGEWDGALRNIRVYKGDSSPLSNSQIVRDMIETASQPRFEGQTVIASYDLVKDTLDRSGNSLNAQNNNISFTKKTVPASLDLGTDLGEDGIVQKTVKFDSGEWGAVFDGSSYMIVKNREKLKIKEKPFSIECSVKTSDTGSNTILSKYQTSGNLRSYSLNIESGKIVFHSSSNGTAVVSSTGSDTINDGSWHKIKVVRESESGTSLKMYVDDVEDTGVGGSLASNFSENISNVAIGAYNTDATAANVFTGNIRELKVFTDDNIERASWELAKDTRDSSSNNYHGENNGITFLTPKQEYGYTVSDSTPLAKQDQYLKEYHKSRLYL